MKRISQSVIQEISSRADIVSVVGDYVRLEKRGNRYLGLCPFHNEKTASFTVNPDKGFFYCFGCKKGGDSITFIKEIEKCSYVEAIERLASKFDILIKYSGDDSPEEIAKMQDKDALYELYKRLATTFNHFLTKQKCGEKALSYILNRKISAETIKLFNLGYAPVDRYWLFSFLRKKSYSEQFLANSGLFSKNHKEVCIFSDRLMFPIFDHRGRICGFGGRLLSGDGPKYINSPETQIYKKNEILYGLFQASNNIRKNEEIILCEGYMDTLAFHEAGVNNAAAPLGTAFTENQANLAKRYAKKAILAFDSDGAGQSATERAISISENSGLETAILRLEKTKDASELLEKYGQEALKKASISTITVDEFMLSNALSIINKGKSKQVAFEYLFPFIKNIDSEIRRDTFLSEACNRFGVDIVSAKSDFVHFLNNEDYHPILKKEEKVVSFLPCADAELVAAIAANDELYEIIRTDISPLLFDDDILKDALFSLEESYRNGDHGIAVICKRFHNEQFRNYVLEKATLGAYSVKPERFIRDGLLRVKLRSLERRKKLILEQIRNYDLEHDGESMSLDDLLFEKMHLDLELTKIKEERHERN